MGRDEAISALPGMHAVPGLFNIDAMDTKCSFQMQGGGDRGLLDH